MCNFDSSFATNNFVILLPTNIYALAFAFIFLFQSFFPICRGIVLCFDGLLVFVYINGLEKKTTKLQLRFLYIFLQYVHFIFEGSVKYFHNKSWSSQASRI